MKKERIIEILNQLELNSEQIKKLFCDDIKNIDIKPSKRRHKRIEESVFNRINDKKQRRIHRQLPSFTPMIAGAFILLVSIVFMFGIFSPDNNINPPDSSETEQYTTNIQFNPNTLTFDSITDEAAYIITCLLDDYENTIAYNEIRFESDWAESLFNGDNTLVSIGEATVNEIDGEPIEVSFDPVILSGINGELMPVINVQVITNESGGAVYHIAAWK